MKQSTKNRILDVAEVLFTEHGFSDTSLRAITGQANVNLASVNYHFGSKKILIQAVLDRYVKVLMPMLNDEFNAFRKSNEPHSIQRVFQCFVKPILALNQVRPGGATRFLILLGRGYVESQGHLRKFMNVHYGDVMDNLLKSIHLACPQLSPEDIFWRLHFTLGTVVFTMTSHKALLEISAADYGQTPDLEAVITKLIPYVSSGFVAKDIN